MSDDLLNSFLFGHDPEPARREIIKAPFSWPGSKVESLNFILPHLKIKPTTKWVDVFGGTGVVSMNVPKCKIMVYNDRNSGLIDFYRTVRDNRIKFEEYLKQCHPWSREEWTHAADTWVEETDTLVRAAKWFYMVRVSFTQMGDTFARQFEHGMNRIGSSMPLFFEVQERFKHFLIENLDARQCLKDFDSPDTVFYLDPPYLDERNPYGSKWLRNDYIQLLDQIETLQGRVILSHRSDAEADSRTFWTDKKSWDVKVFAGKRETTRCTKTEVIYIKDAK